MSKIIEIFWYDLTPKAQEKLIKVAKELPDELGEIFPGNYDVFPLATIELSDEVDN